MERVTIDDIRPLFGRRIDDPEVVAFLARFPDHRVGKPSDGAQYVLFRSLGFDLMFRPPTGYQGGRTKHLRVLECAFLFREGEERHREFAGLPPEITFADTHEELVRKLGAPVEGTVSVWRRGGLEFSPTYDRETKAVRTFILQPATTRE